MALGKIFSWLQTKTPSIPDALWQETLAAQPFLAALDDDEKSRLRKLAEAFLASKEFSGAGDLEVTDAMCVSIAAQGCLLILNLGLDYYRDWVGIIVYPDEFVIPRKIEDEFGVVHEYDDVASGEAWAGGPLLVSWGDMQLSGEGYNVVIHEFAHKLDMLSGEANGIPPLPLSLRDEWEKTLHEAYDDFCEFVDEVEARGEESWFDPYAAENPSEFFAVMSEAFFEEPAILREDYPALYALFTRFYRQDPASRPGPQSAN
jgi:Mlc titration factor MtfA (ptsG expression regulator)